MIVLDATVLVYATGVASPFREPCRRLLAAVAAGGLTATTTVEVIQEFVHVRSRRQGRDDAAALGSSYAVLLSPLVQVDADDLERGLQLYRGAEALGAFDAVLAATARSRQAAALVSADAAFGSVPGLTAVVPDDAGVDRVLEG